MNIKDAEQFLISRGKVPTLTEDGRQEFHWAISEGLLDEVKAWLAFGMKIDTEHEDSFPIIRAAEGKDPKMVAFFADLGADLNVRDRDGDTALHTAVNWDAEDALKMLIEKKSPLDTSNDTGRTPLISALEKGGDYVELLLASGADPNYGDHYGTATLAFAASEAPEYLQTLIDHGGDLNRIVKGQTLLTERIIADEYNDEVVRDLIKAGADPLLENAFGWTPMMVCRVRDASDIRDVLLGAGLKEEAPHQLVDLFEDRNDPDLESIKLFLKGLDVDVKDEVGRTLLNYVAGSGDLEIVSYLLEQGADPNATIDDSSPLSSAASDDQHQVVKLLLDKGAKPNDENGNSEALSTAALMSATKSVALLLEAGANPSSHDEYLESALHQAIYEGPKKLIQLLLSAGADPNHFNHIQTSPLMYAIDQDRPKVVAAILKAGADVNLQDSHGKTALYHATERGYDYGPKLKECIEILLNAGADGKLTSFSSTPYSNASGSYEEIADQILTFETTHKFEKFGADDLSKFAEEVSAYHLQLWIKKDLKFAKELIQAGAGKDESGGFSPVFDAVEMDDSDLLNLLLEHGFSANALNVYNESILQVACRRKDLKIIDLLLKAGADVNYMPEDMSSDILSYAVQSGEAKVVQRILKEDVDVNAMKAGWTALWRAASAGNLEIVKLLVEAGASKEVKTRQNKTAADVAVENEHTEIAKYLA